MNAERTRYEARHLHWAIEAEGYGIQIPDAERFFAEMATRLDTLEKLARFILLTRHEQYAWLFAELRVTGRYMAGEYLLKSFDLLAPLLVDEIEKNARETVKNARRMRKQFWKAA